VAGPKSNFVDKVLGRIGRLHAEGLQTVVQRLARERAFLESLFNAIEDGVLVLDEKGRILYFNRAVTQLLGLPAEGAENQPITRFVPDLDWERLSSSVETSGAGVVRHELEVFYPRPRFLSFYVTPLDGEHAESAGLALVIHDITEAREKTFAAVESERLHALTLLAASVAHEIGNPLNALHIHLQLVERELRKLKATLQQLPKPRARFGRRKHDEAAEGEAADIHAKLEKYTAVAKGEIVRLDSIVTQFLQAIRPSPPQLQMASLNNVVTETLELLRPEIENRGVDVQQRLAPKLPLSRIDPGQIKQALVNLIRNALQAMTRGGDLTLETGTRSDALYVSVSDTGRGIPDDEVQRIFEPFFTTKKKGSGLGLMIVQRIVRDHGGQIELESRVGHGTTFRIWLPLQERKPRLLGAGQNGDQPQPHRD
jgi:two-component system, sporulation sensor kinase E